MADKLLRDRSTVHAMPSPGPLSIDAREHNLEQSIRTLGRNKKSLFVENTLLELLGSLASPITAGNSNKFPMATQDSDDSFVESIEIPSSIKDIYTAACRNDQSIAESLSIPSDRISATLLVQGPGREVIAKIEEQSLRSNIELVTAVNDKDHTAGFYLLDGVSRKVLYSATQKGVDTTQPIASVMSENWFVYSFFGDVTDETSAKGYQLVISELYESSIPNDRGPLDYAADFSSLNGASDASPPLPHVISQAFIIPEPISHMAVTQTRQGITTRQLLCTLPESSSIVGIPRPVLDPRRPVDRDPTASEAEEGLFRYAPLLEFDGKWFITHARDVSDIKTVLSEPTLLESTNLIFAFGGDIFGTRATPSQAFDVLGKSFSKLQLILAVVALAIGVAFLAPMKQVNLLWKAN
ncbi:uncharacterized protein N7515_004798 [Penicillium bovifimosum]|uniref:ER membrane protein complex subunit 1 n=1 Tax=Penicillium bovifimosum TaxID=126998 RepID=A0A9W9H0Y8_9EURO|nr:uncharacterized protein N7515_004798 [Penicillium bovifimosum]KAJ5135520.1 hypothetical protein N7515_004798 [Penicillium bovifimosum]